MMKRFRRYFFAGMVIILPIVASIWMLNFIFNLMTGWFMRLTLRITGYYNLQFLWYHLLALRILVLLIMVVTIMLLVAFATRAIGSRMTQLFQRSLEKIPLFNRVYGFSKQVINAFAMLNSRNSEFKRVALIEYPKAGIFTMAFITNQTGPRLSGYIRKQVRSMQSEQRFVNLFVPTTPNPTSGFFLVMPASSVYMLDIPVEDAVKLIISGGAVTLDEVIAELDNGNQHLS